MIVHGQCPITKYARSSFFTTRETTEVVTSRPLTTHLRHQNPACGEIWAVILILEFWLRSDLIDYLISQNQRLLCCRGVKKAWDVPEAAAPLLSWS